MKKQVALLSTLLLSFFYAQAQDGANDDHNVNIDIPEVAILDLESSSGTSLILNIIAPQEAGLPVDFSQAKDSSIWLNYSSIVGSTTEASRSISVKIISGIVPQGTRLRIRAAVDVNQGAGDMGTRTGWKVLSNSNQNIINGIGSCFTGNGPGKGHNIYYSLELRTAAGNYKKLDFNKASTVTVLYTISNN